MRNVLKMHALKVVVKRECLMFLKYDCLNVHKSDRLMFVKATV